MFEYEKPSEYTKSFSEALHITILVLRSEYEKPSICASFVSSIETQNPLYDLTLAVLAMKKPYENTKSLREARHFTILVLIFGYEKPSKRTKS